MDSRLRRVLNLVNLSTPLGLLVARAGGATTRPGPDRLLVAVGYRLPLPTAPAFTLGDVVLLRRESQLARPRLLAHEGRHAVQYAWCLGPFMVPLYLVAAAWSWLRTGCPASRNIFERRAGLADGGYVERPLRRALRDRPLRRALRDRPLRRA